MTTSTIEKDIVTKRIAGIEAEIFELQKLARQKKEEFSTGQGWKLAQFHLHRALEGVFNISTHILSRFPGTSPTQYAEIARKMGEYGIVDKNFAEEKLVKMAKYRNRLVHFYSEISASELYQIINNNLADFETFLKGIKKLLENPKEFGLDIES